MSYLKIRTIIIRTGYCLIACMALGHTSCKKDFLEVENTGQLYRQNYVKDLTTMEHFLNGIYILINGIYEHGYTASYPDLVADNLKPASATSSQLLLPHYAWSQQAEDLLEFIPSSLSMSMNSSWTNGYQIIRACSFVIEDIEKYRSENSSKADNIKGQAYAIRAMVHIKLVNIFAQSYKFTDDASHPGIPYINTSDISKPYSRQTVSKVYDNIIADLDDAIQLLPSEVTDTRYMNSAAAKAFLARTYLFKGDYTNAKSLAAEICLRFPLLKITGGYPSALFRNRLPSQTEVMYRLVPINISGNLSNFLGRFFVSPLNYMPTNDIVTLLTENRDDVRKFWVTNGNVTKFPTGAAPEVSPQPLSPASAYYPSMIRSSEMFLTVSECAAKLGDEVTARSFLDSVRQRANPSVGKLSATGAALLDSIYKERRKELCFEGIRMFDLQRMKMSVQRGVDAVFPNAISLPFYSKMAVAPIPVWDVKLAGLSQNPGY